MISVMDFDEADSEIQGLFDWGFDMTPEVVVVVSADSVDSTAHKLQLLWMKRETFEKHKRADGSIVYITEVY